VLVAGGTGFAPMWSIATAALDEDPEREMVVVVGGRALDDLYMVRALCRLARHANVRVIPVTDMPQTVTPVIRSGRPTDHVPKLFEDDMVYACGAPPMVEAVARMAAAAGARCYADAFVPPQQSDDGLLSRAMIWMTAARRASALAGVGGGGLK
jgi:3-phenylpropionate/trans-cinnamate dioxygenase ferredoxin reductase subunit